MRCAKEDVKWVERENLHVTLCFLGAVGSENFLRLTALGEESAKKFRGFPVLFQDLGAFPSFREPDVIWIGMAYGKEELTALVQELETRLISLAGIQKDLRRFQAHVTLGRVTRRSKNIISSLEKIKGKVYPFQPWLLREFSLQESSLTARGPIYSTFSRFSLR